MPKLVAADVGYKPAKVEKKCVQSVFCLANKQLD